MGIWVVFFEPCPEAMTLIFSQLNENEVMPLILMKMKKMKTLATYDYDYDYDRHGVLASYQILCPPRPFSILEGILSALCIVRRFGNYKDMMQHSLRLPYCMACKISIYFVMLLIVK